MGAATTMIIIRRTGGGGGGRGREVLAVLVVIGILVGLVVRAYYDSAN